MTKVIRAIFATIAAVGLSLMFITIIFFDMLFSKKKPDLTPYEDES